MRKEISENLIRVLRVKFGSERLIKVLIVGGSDLDPEVINLKKNFGTEISYAGIETEKSLTPYFYLDLNSEFENKLIPKNFDLIMCNQVFEHIFDVKNALKTFAYLCDDQTIIWIDFPTSTFPHGSPHFFTSGIMPQMLENLALELDLKTLDSGVIGSRRDHLFGHALNVWPSSHQSKHPFWSFYGINGGALRKIVYQFKVIPMKIALATTSRKPSNDIAFSTTGWIILANQNS